MPYRAVKYLTVLFQLLRISFHNVLDIKNTSYLNTYYIEKSGCTSREEKT